EVRRQAVVWVLRNNKPEPVLVELGAADNSYTLVHGGLSEGDVVITGGGAQATSGRGGQQQGGPSIGGGGMRIRGA
ncbi:MAG TPA: hypothetical protein PKY87_14235, partial [Terricaulis sp.]|nr:hypothetical protein [Terricaulis sp.]